MILAPEMQTLVKVSAAVVGAMIGSFLNVCIHRLPRYSRSIVHPPSHCPVCGASIRPWDNIPILSFLLLWGKCRGCRSRISWRYPLVEALTSAIFLGVTCLWLGNQHSFARLANSGISVAEQIGVLVITFGFVGALLVATFVDLRYRIIPDEISLLGLCVAPLLCAAIPSMLHQLPSSEVVRNRHLAGFLGSLLGAIVGGGGIYFIGVVGKAIFGKEAMGFGDVKLLAMIGAFLGWGSALLTFLLACLVGAVLGGVSLLVTRDRYTPFGPYLALGALTVHLFYPSVVRFVFVTWPSLIREWMGVGAL